MPASRYRLRPRVLRWMVLLVLLAIAALPAGAAAALRERTLTYHGFRLVVPAAWPVISLQEHPGACVRFNRHAVYLGEPSGDQRCPASAAGRTEAVLISPLGSATGEVLPQTIGKAALPGSEARLVNRAHRLMVTATWNHDPALIRRALGLRSLAAAASSPGPAPSAAAAIARPRARQAGAVATPGQVFTGLGFDACSTPSSAQMSAWGASPYRAIGVYIGGTNMACSQPNLSATWVSLQSTLGWHLIPIYVGLQAPSNSCGCAPIATAPATAASEGAAAAQDAVVDAQSIGLGPGNPLYDDMESYTHTTANTSAVLAFLSAWTAQLHASGYESGIYSSSDGGVEDLVAEYGTGYAEPDDLWIANWNNQQNTADPNVPAQDWAAHQRLHQYQGGHNETYGGVKINIDGDYVDGATAAAGTGAGVAPPTPAAAPSLAVSAGPDGTLSLTPSWLYEPGIASWQVIAGSNPASLTWVGPTVAAAAHFPLVTRNTFSYYAVQALSATGQVIGSSAPVADPAHLAIFGTSVFVPRHGLGSVPVGCYGVSRCTLTTTIWVGRTTLAVTGPEHLGGSDGLAYFQLTAKAQAMLLRAAQHQMAVDVRVRASTGTSVTRKLTLTSFLTLDPSPPRSISQSAQLRFVGTTEFVAHGWVGGILVSCAAGAPCQASAKLVSAGKVIAQSRPAAIGAAELGYLFFSLTSAGHKLLVHAAGNQLAATVTLTNTTTAAAPGTGSATGSGSGAGTVMGVGAASTTTAKAHIALVSFQ